MNLFSQTISLEEYLDARRTLDFNNVDRILLIQKEDSISVKIYYKTPEPIKYNQNLFSTFEKYKTKRILSSE